MVPKIEEEELADDDLSDDGSEGDVSEDDEETMGFAHDFQSLEPMAEYVKTQFFKGNAKKRIPTKSSAIPFQPNQKREHDSAFTSRSKISRTPYRE